MVDSVIRGDRRVKWTHIMEYLEANTYTDHDHQVPLPLESPLPAFCHASKELARELTPCLKSGDSVLRRTVLGGGPQRIVAALCHLAPKALAVPDSKGRVLLHLATRVPVTAGSEAVLQVLLQAHPAALLTRDSYGRTPLHWLLWYHCSERQVDVVSMFCRTLSKQKLYSLPSNLPDTVIQDCNFALPAVPRPQQDHSSSSSSSSKIPPTAAILPDAVYGCLPLHYAVANGASLDVIRTLLLAYPLSKNVTDRYGRTAAHWYLGAGQVVFGNHHTASLLHISGEQPNPHATPWHQTPVHADKLQALLSSRVARTLDGMGRNLLHWACFTLANSIYHSSANDRTQTTIRAARVSGKDTVDCQIQPYMEAIQMAIPILQLLMDAHTNQILGTDEDGQTPFLVLLDTLYNLQSQDVVPLPYPNPYFGGFKDPNMRSSRIGFEFSPVLLRMLMEHPDSGRALMDQSNKRSDSNRQQQQRQPQTMFPASIEDSKGRLPLHVAVAIGCGIQTLSTLVQAHPTGLVHTTDTYQSPLHMALCNPLVTPYWTASTLTVLLQTYHTGSSPLGGDGHGSVVVDGRMALKMEDMNGVYPIHFATQNNASVRVLESLLQAYPAIALQVRHDSQDLAVFHVMPNHMTTKEEEDDDRKDDRDAELSIKSYDAQFRDMMHDLLRGQESSQTTTHSPSSISARQKKHIFNEVLPVLKQKLQLFIPILLQDAESSSNASLLQRPDSRHHMHLLHVAVLFQGATYSQLAQLLKLFPDSAKHICNCLQDPPPPQDQLPDEGSTCEKEPATPPEWTVLDLHEAVQPHWLGESMDEWHHIRQLLFAHFPFVPSHRRRQELLTQCVHIVVQEVAYKPKLTEDEYRDDKDPTLQSSFHWYALQEAAEEEMNAPDVEISHSLSAIENSVRLSLNIRQPPLPIGPSNRLRGSRTKGSSSRPTNGQQQPRRKNILASVREMSRRKHSRKHAKNRSKYDEDEAKYEVAGSDEEDSDESMSSYSRRDEEGSYTSGDDDDEEGSFSSEAYTDTEGETTDRAFSTDDNSFSTNQPSRTFSSEADSSHWSPRSSMDATERRLQRHFKSKHQQQSESDAFDRAIRTDISASESMEEKKDDIGRNQANAKSSSKKHRETSHVPGDPSQGRFAHRPKYMSEVGMRMWTFFALYCDVNNPNDTYVDQISAIFGEIPFSKVEQLVQMHLPSYAIDYLKMDEIFGASGELQAFRDVASPKCRELIHKTCFFVGTYEFWSDLDSKTGEIIKSSASGYDLPLLVYCRPDDRHSFAVHALEWAFTTQEATNAATTPGLTEEEIWQTGVMPAETGVTFRSRRKQVVMHFTQDLAEYENEQTCRKALNTDNKGVARRLEYYDATEHDRHVDRRYRIDINDDRFKRLVVGRDREFLLQNYPFAFVYNLTDSLDNVFSTFGGLESREEAKSVCRQIGEALRCIHNCYVVHGNVSMRNVVQESNPDGEHRWVLRDFSCGSASVLGQPQPFLGRISSEGKPLFSTATLPPEMFVQLSEIELQAYDRYWLFVEKAFSVSVDRSAIDPVVDSESGDTFVPRCYYTPPAGSSIDLPLLPYDLVVASPATDYWAFGLLVFEICTGRPLFATEPRSGRLLEFHRHVKWSNKTSASLIYNNVKDHIYQDLFLQLLSPLSRRADLTLEKILGHPFFAEEEALTSSAVKNMIETRRRDTVAHKRLLQKKLHESSESGWLSQRTTRLDCWDLTILAKFHESSASVVGQMASGTQDTMAFPSSFIVLPYKFSVNSKSQLVPENVEDATTTGTCFINLCKICFLASELGRTIEGINVDTGAGNLRKVSISDLIDRLDLPKDDFSEALKQCTDIASHHVESFRENPHYVVRKILQGALEKFFDLFSQGDAWLYMVDEFNYIPIAEGVWTLDGTHREEVVRRSVLTTVLTCICSWRSAGHIAGITGLLNQIACPGTPQEWSEASRGLDPTTYDNDHIILQISALQDALTEMTQTRHSLGNNDLAYLRDYLSVIDPTRRLGGLCRAMVSSNIGLWTTKQQCQQLESRCKKFSMQDALRSYASSLPDDQ